VTQAWLAVSNDLDATVSGQHFLHQRPVPAPAEARSVPAQETFLDYCESLTGATLGATR